MICCYHNFTRQNYDNNKSYFGFDYDWKSTYKYLQKKRKEKKKWNFHGAGSEKSQDYYNIKKLSYI